MNTTDFANPFPCSLSWDEFIAFMRSTGWLNYLQIHDNVAVILGPGAFYFQDTRSYLADMFNHKSYTIICTIIYSAYDMVQE